MKKWIPFLELASLHREISGELRDKFIEVLEDGVFSAGKEVDLLEKNVKRMLNIPHAIPCSNGTDALEVALKTLGIGHGDEVIVPALTWVSTAEAVVNVGAKPIFCDVDEDGLIAVRAAEKLIHRGTKAVIPVHLYGKMVNMNKLSVFSQKHQIKVIEDAAQSFGSIQQGSSSGAFGDFGCFSFYPTKNLGALGEAGMLTTKDPVLAEKSKWLVNHGQVSRNVHELPGRNSKIDSLQAAFLNVKLRYFPLWQDKRKKLAALYLEGLQGIENLYLPHGVLEADHNVHLFSIRTDQRNRLKVYLEHQGIETAIHYPAVLPKTAAFYGKSSFPKAEEISRTTLSLPLHPHLLEEEVVYICGKIKVFFKV